MRNLDSSLLVVVAKKEWPNSSISQVLCEHLLTVQRRFVLDNEKACRMLIDAILIEVLKSEFNDSLYGFCEVQNDWEGDGFGFTGTCDYMVASSKSKSVESMDSFLLVVEAKKNGLMLPLLRFDWRLGRILLCLPFSPMVFSFASLLLILMVWYMLPRFIYWELEMTKLTIPAPLYLKFFVGSLGS